jgi:DNA-cytosine methyltransferase
MKYMSLFSGIGGFEIAIQNIFPNAVCVGFSEVDKHAIAVYKHHFPTHENMGSVTDITEKQIKKIIQNNGGIDLIIGGFPCQNLSSLARCFKYTNSDGLEGPKSSLFYSMIQVIKWIQKYNPVDLHLLAENNASMSSANKKLITDTFEGVFKKVWMTKLNGADFGVQTRRRLYWTTFEVSVDNIVCSQTWDDVLEPMEKCVSYCLNDTYVQNVNNNEYAKSTSKFKVEITKTTKGWLFKKIEVDGIISKWQRGYHSDNGNNSVILYPYTYGKCTPCLCGGHFDKILIDRRVSKNKKQFIVRHFTPIEVERLFGVPDGWVSKLCSKSRSYALLGNTVVVKVVEHILNYFAKNTGLASY